jgi:hypothetical protein
MSPRISFACPRCKARIKASVRFAGRSCPCPGCGHELVVPQRQISDEPSVLVLDDGHRRASGYQRAG